MLMKNYQKYLFILITLLIGLAFLPAVANAFAEEFGWEGFANVYQLNQIFLPAILK